MRLPAKVFIAIGTAMALALLWVAGQPGAAEIFPGKWHYVAHFVIFTILGGVWALGLPRIPVSATVAGIVAFGFIHEAFEIRGHAHGFELYDAIIDGAGAIAGTLSARFTRAAFTAT
jgi:hypothetical protein